LRETCARITAHVDAVETRVRTRVHSLAPQRHTGSGSLMSDAWRFARGLATGYIAMRKWIGVDSHR